jgi:catechol-2,3-dioxygenase
MTTAAPIRGVSHIQLTVSDVPKAESWYASVLGLDRLQANEDGSYVALVHRPSRVVVVLSTYVGDATKGGPFDHLAFSVADGPTLQAWAEQLTEQGINHPGVVDEFGKPSLLLSDPDGNQIELVAPAGSW